MNHDSDPALPTLHVSDYFERKLIIRDGTFCRLDEAEAIQQGAMAYCQNLYYLQKAITNLNVSAVLTTPELAQDLTTTDKAVVACVDPRFAFFELYNALYGASVNASSPNPSIGRDCRIHSSAHLGSNVTLGDRVELAANVVVENFSIIANDVYIGPNAVIGAEGLITLRHHDGRLLTVKHAGGVQIDEGTQVLAGAVIAKSLFSKPTHIGKNCQVGILANIGHGASVGNNSVISGNTVIAGRTRIGQNVWIGASVSIAQGLSVGHHAQIKMGSVVVGNVDDASIVSGNFALSHKANMKDFLRKQRT